jgi:peroxiredoxin
VSANPLPAVGQTAPPIHAETATGPVFDLTEHAGQYVVVYFYPRANTPG